MPKRPLYRDVNRILKYDPDTGFLIYKVDIPYGAWVKKGQRAGCVRKGGRYRVIRIEGVNYEEHQICWLLYYKKWPKTEIDHRNKNKLQNNIENLRAATHSQNQANKGLSKSNKSGYKGVRQAADGVRWAVSIKVNNHMRSLGVFRSRRKAAKAYNKAAEQAWGEFAHLNVIPPRKVKSK
jgi:hypothetical protein